MSQRILIIIVIFCTVHATSHVTTMPQKIKGSKTPASTHGDGVIPNFAQRWFKIIRDMFHGLKNTPPRFATKTWGLEGTPKRWVNVLVPSLNAIYGRCIEVVVWVHANRQPFQCGVPYSRYRHDGENMPHLDLKNANGSIILQLVKGIILITCKKNISNSCVMLVDGIQI